MQILLLILICTFSTLMIEDWSKLRNGYNNRTKYHFLNHPKSSCIITWYLAHYSSQYGMLDLTTNDGYDNADFWYK